MKLSLEEQVKKSVAILKEGGVIAFPTDTLYGLGAHPFQQDAVQRIFQIKRRPQEKAVPLLLANVEDLALYALEVPPLAWKLAHHFLPGVLTLVLLKAARVPDYLTGGSNTIALRVPDHPVPRAIAKGLGAPITGTSANISGMPGVSTADEVRQRLGDTVDFIVDAGPSPGGMPSTVVDLSRDRPMILREGAISRSQIEEVCSQSVPTQIEVSPRRA